MTNITFVRALQNNDFTVREPYCPLVIPCSYSTVIGLISQLTTKTVIIPVLRASGIKSLALFYVKLIKLLDKEQII